MSTKAPPPPREVRPATLADVRRQAVDVDRHRRTLPTGFAALDTVLVGGLRTQNLTILGGRPGVGKTVCLLQWARHLASQGEVVVLACYEHDERTMLDRLLLLELGELRGEVPQPELDAARAALGAVARGTRRLDDAAAGTPALATALERMQRYDDALLVVRASGTTTSPPALAAMVEAHDATVLMVDYLQKVPTDPWQGDDRLRVMAVAQQLKDLAMRRDIAVVASAIADRAGLEAPRLRLRHLAGSSSLTYESDAVLLLNEKYDIVHRTHIAFDPEKARDHRRWVVLSVEKHRDGASGADLQFRKDLALQRFEPTGDHVMETLVDERTPD